MENKIKMSFLAFEEELRQGWEQKETTCSVKVVALSKATHQKYDKISEIQQDFRNMTRIQTMCKITHNM